MTIRPAEEKDKDELLRIYSYYIENTAITFEYATPSIEEFKNRIASIGRDYPYLVAIEYNQIVGYAYAHAFNTRPAYQWCVETSIYIDKDFRCKGIGRMLYERLEKELSRMGIIKLIACISTTDKEDIHLNNNSYHFHAHMGYKKCAEIKNIGYKFDRWWDVFFMEKNIEKAKDRPEKIVPYSCLLD